MLFDHKDIFFLLNIQLHLDRFHSEIQLKDSANGKLIFGVVRQKWLSLTPEELIRQSLLHYLIKEKYFSKKRISVEKEIPFFESYKRFDILYYDRQAKPILLVECKSHKHKITQKVLDQIAIYNQVFKVPYMVVSNGIQTVCLKLDKDNSGYIALDRIPDTKELQL